MRRLRPASYESQTLPILNLPNHSSGNQHPIQVASYLDKEMKLGAMVGPFDFSPFEWTRTNTIMVRPKKEVGKFHVILDLSFPEGNSVNGFVPSLSYDGGPYKLRLPTALDLAEEIAKTGPMCYLYKLYLARAYRQLPSDPLDWLLLGVHWENKYWFDKSIPFGLGHGAMNCQRVTSAICYAVDKELDAPLVPYIDDMGGAAPNNLEMAQAKYEGVCETITKMVLDLALEKCHGPSKFMTWTCMSYDSIRMIMSIEMSKVEETLELAFYLFDKCDVSLKDIETLIGKLQHAIKFCPGGH